MTSREDNNKEESDAKQVDPPVEDLPAPVILRVFLAAVMIGAALCFATHLITRARMGALRPSHRFPERDLPAPTDVSGVRQQLFRIANPAPSLAERERAALEQYGWVDRQARVVQIPIERAIDVIAGESAPRGNGR